MRGRAATLTGNGGAAAEIPECARRHADSGSKGRYLRGGDEVMGAWRSARRSWSSLSDQVRLSGGVGGRVGDDGAEGAVGAVEDDEGWFGDGGEVGDDVECELQG